MALLFTKYNSFAADDFENILSSNMVYPYKGKYNTRFGNIVAKLETRNIFKKDKWRSIWENTKKRNIRILFDIWSYLLEWQKTKTLNM